MDWLDKIVTGLQSVLDKPDVLWSGAGFTILGILYFVIKTPLVAIIRRLLGKSPPPPAGDTDDWFFKNRDKLLERLKRDLDDRRESFLFGQSTLELEKELSPDAVDRPYRRQDSIEYTLERDGKIIETTDQPITELFQDKNVGQRLAILGKPGSGKTVCLLALVELLLKQAEEDIQKPLPIIFECSEWDGRELVPWMSWQLNRKYDIQEKTARQMVEERDILPLFDGLDELAAEKQGDFVRLFNALPNDRPQVVCCRVKEYGQLQKNSGVKLALKNAVILQDISLPRLKGHLLRQGLNELWNMLEQSEHESASASSSHEEEGQEKEQPQSLLELARRPLFLGIMIGVAEKLREGFKRRQGESWEDLLWRLYLNDCLAPRTPPPNEAPDEHDRKYAQAPSRHWLHCLAKWMQTEDKVALHIDELQPSMLMGYWRFGVIYGLIFGLAWGMLIGLFTWPLLGIAVGLSMGMLYGLPGSFGLKENVNLPIALSWTIAGSLAGQSIFGLVAGVFFMITARDKQIKINSIRPVRLPISIRDVKDFIVPLCYGLFFEFAIGLVCGLVLGLLEAQEISLGGWLAAMSALWLNIGLVIGLVAGLRAVVGPLDVITNPQQRLNNTLLNSLVFFPFFILTSAIFFVQPLLVAEQWGIDVSPFFRMQMYYMILSGIAIISFFVLGTNEVLQHYLLRLCLRTEHQLPLRLVPWLNTMHQRKVFQRVGGSYHFLHKQLRDYLAKQQSTPLDQKEKIERR